MEMTAPVMHEDHPVAYWSGGVKTPWQLFCGKRGNPSEPAEIQTYWMEFLEEPFTMIGTSTKWELPTDYNPHVPGLLGPISPCRTVLLPPEKPLYKRLLQGLTLQEFREWLERRREDLIVADTAHGSVVRQFIRENISIPPKLHDGYHVPVDRLIVGFCHVETESDLPLDGYQLPQWAVLLQTELNNDEATILYGYRSVWTKAQVQAALTRVVKPKGLR